MRRVILLAAACLCGALWAADEKPIPCTLNVSQLRGDSHTTRSGGNSLHGHRSNSLTSGTGTKTIERSLKWHVEMRFREQKPEKLELKAYHIGFDNGGKRMTILAAETKPIELDKNGRADLELNSPKVRLTKTRTRTTTGGSSRTGNGGFTSIKTSMSGKRVTGCVVQLIGDGKLVKSWSSDSRWTIAADKVPFTIDELKKKSGKIGLR